ncbi:hypothetical protein [Sphingomonas oryzagri]|uniref:Uncharacterized protein n=1 Tax=Sphingomonas oryzagri TaxID=3042314 RepID=A0ABT6N2D8_9SPHN|nr:hypothetical protein [Sphingomonas oryzagri]MDH7638958.1 hypothetical protein [Sphingomonas oryzagri]
MPETTVTRADLQKITNDPKVLRWLESLAGIGKSNSDAIAGLTDATQGITAATALTLSNNAALDNERVFTPDPAVFTATDGGPGGQYGITLVYLITLNGGFACTFNLAADTNLDLPPSGQVMTTDFQFPGPYADDVAAAAAGVAVNAAYRKTGGSMAWRVS